MCIIQRLPCRHCRAKPRCRPRGLCWGCYFRPGIKERYPATSKYGRRGAANHNRNLPLPVATSAPPGSPEKVAVLAERARLGLQLFHPDDAP